MAFTNNGLFYLLLVLLGAAIFFYLQVFVTPRLAKKSIKDISISLLDRIFGVGGWKETTNTTHLFDLQTEFIAEFDGLNIAISFMPSAPRGPAEWVAFTIPIHYPIRLSVQTTRGSLLPIFTLEEDKFSDVPTPVNLPNFPNLPAQLVVRGLRPEEIELFLTEHVDFRNLLYKLFVHPRFKSLHIEPPNRVQLKFDYPQELKAEEIAHYLTGLIKSKVKHH